MAKLFRIRFIMDLPGLLMGRHFKLVGRKSSINDRDWMASPCAVDQYIIMLL